LIFVRKAGWVCDILADNGRVFATKPIQPDGDGELRGPGVMGFLEPRGFERIQDATHTFLQDAYFTGANCQRKVTDGYAIASAVVKER